MIRPDLLPDQDVDQAFAYALSTGFRPTNFLPWRKWLREHFPHVAFAEPAPRHVAEWEWFSALRRGVKPRARVEIAPRGGGKSTTYELACTRCAETLQRRFVLIVSDTQDQADLHVSSIAAFLERRGIERAVGRYGRPKAWNRQQLRTREGFHVAAFGLDAAARGIKIEEYRPDLIVFDDVDNQDDTPLITKKKIGAITTAVLPAGSSDCAVLFVENFPHEDAISRQLWDGRADFLRDRVVIDPEPAVRSLQWEERTDEEGRPLYRITGGEATWQGQPLSVCEAQLNEWGLRAFLREAQHELKSDPRHKVFGEDCDYLEAMLPMLQDPDHEAEHDFVPGHPEFYPEGRNGLNGRLEVWARPVVGVKYVIGADVAEGLHKEKTDESTADVLRLDTWEHVASYYGKPKPRAFGFDLYNLASWYNRAVVVPENNSFGVGTVEALIELGANVFENDPGTNDDGGETEDQDQDEGMRTTGRTKGMVDAALMDAVEAAAAGRQSILLRSRRVVEQMIHYVYLPNRKRGGEGMWHDDHVRSIGLAWYIAKDHGLHPPPEPRKVTGNAYGGYWRGRGR